MRGQAVINLRAGTVLDLSPDEVERIVRDGFAAGGHEIDVHMVPPDELEARLDELAAAPGDILIVGGGDGTLRSGAERLVGKDKALGILPLGTMNRYARDLRIPLELTDAVAALAAGEIVPVDVAEVNGRLFLCNSAMGLQVRYARRRHQLRGRGAAERMVGYWRAIRSVLRSRQRLALTVDDGGDQRIVRAMSLAVSNNLYAEEPSLFLTRARLDGGTLGLYISRHRSGLRMAWALVRVMTGLWHGDPYLDVTQAREITIRAKGRLHLTNDGEVEAMDPPLHYRVRPRALNILRPAQS